MKNLYIIFAGVLLLTYWTGCSLLSSRGTPNFKVTEFVYSKSNLTLAPENEYQKTIRGKINTHSINLNFEYKVGRNETKQDLELKDEEYKRALDLIQNTKFKEEKREATDGGSTSYVNLAGTNNDESIAGEPLNEEEWSSFFEEIKKQVNSQKIIDASKEIEINSQSADAHNTRGWIYLDEREYDLAVKDLTKAIEINPEFAQAYKNRAHAYRALGEDDLADTDERKYRELGGNKLSK